MKFILAIVLAALVSFTWGYVSWMQLGWHQAGTFEFKDEAAVSEVLKENATNGHGLYQLPYPRKALDYQSEEEKAAQLEKIEAANAEGPHMYAIVRPGKRDGDMVQSLIRSFVRSLICCLLIASMMNSMVLAYPARVCFVAAFGAFAGLAVDAQQWIWFELPLRDLIVNVADHFIEWTLAGLVLGLFLGKEPNVNDID
ncbi:MAG: hypothetical protein NTV80_23005 [Verrucomicrobia bacterium]|nr:hypothetical protein [Verrucomicrobiota bacterium]